MMTRIRAAAAALALVLSSGLALAQSPPPAAQPAPPPPSQGTDLNKIIGQVAKQLRPLAACKGDVEKLCPGIGKGEARKCLRDNTAKLSPECSAAIADLEGKVKAMRQACKEDVKSLCAEGAKGAAVVQCLRESRPKLTPACASAFDARYPREKS
ncbi:MAG: hypothetical protein JSS20_09915 [Proteobacteria bacterium]|nr:hypothetical protein [Pseudomonadota bacterium]